MLYSIHNAPNKRASTLIDVDPNIDEYHRMISDSALVLVTKNLGEAKYQTQWMSGTTLWRLPNDTHVTVDRNGIVKNDKDETVA